MFFSLLMSCTGKPECPPCGKEGTGSGAANGASDGRDAGLEEGDGGIAASAIGGKPKKVTSFELYGRAGFLKVSVFSKPDTGSPRLGYLFKGARIRLGDPKYSTEDCPNGWFELQEGGFVCQGRGMLVGAKPRYIRNAPPKPLLDELDPYRHGFIRNDWTPVYKHIPADEEMWTPPVRDLDAGTEMDGGAAPADILPHSEEGVDGGVNYDEYTKKHFKAVSALLSRGFWVSVASRRFDETTRRYYYETVKGEFVPGERVHMVRPTSIRGYEVLGDNSLPAAIVTDKHANLFELRNGKYLGSGPVDRLNSYHVYEIAEYRGGKYYKIDGDRWLKSTQVELFDLRKPPEGVGDREKWILVDLSRQTLEAYEGAMPVYVTMVSTGLVDSEETVTPRGRFNISFKHLTDDMQGTVGDDETYSVEDVPWVQYIHQNVALHSSFWHSSYGRPKSHGCVNLAPADARWLFDWTEPSLPKGWHGVASSEKKRGTLVIIQGETPK